MLEILGRVTRGVDRPDRDDLHLLGSLVEPIDEVLVRPVNDVGIAWIGQYESCFAVRRVVPVALHDGTLVIHARDGDARIVLLSAVEVIGETRVDRHMVELGRRLVVNGAPGLATVEGDRRSAIARFDDAVGLGRVDPDAVMVAMARRQELEGLAAVGGPEQAGVLGVYGISVLRVRENGGEVPGALAEPSVIIDALPVLAAIVGAVQTALLRLDHRVYAFRVRRRDADVNTSEDTRRQSIAGELLPAHTPVGRAVQATARTAAREVPRLATCLPERGVDGARIVWIEADIDRSGVLVLVEHLGPGLAAVGRAKDAAFRIRSEGVAECRDQHDIRIVRIDDHRPDLTRVLEAEMAPGLAAIDRAVHAISVGHVPARRSLAGPDVDDAVVGWRDGDGADRADRGAIGQRLPGVTAIGCLPHTARHSAEIKGAAIAGYAGDREGASTTVGADAAPSQCPKEARVNGHGSRGGRRSGGGCGARAGRLQCRSSDDGKNNATAHKAMSPDTCDARVHVFPRMVDSNEARFSCRRSYVVDAVAAYPGNRAVADLSMLCGAMARGAGDHQAADTRDDQQKSQRSAEQRHAREHEQHDQHPDQHQNPLTGENLGTTVQAR